MDSRFEPLNLSDLILHNPLYAKEKQKPSVRGEEPLLFLTEFMGRGLFQAARHFCEFIKIKIKIRI